jgi:hypothetical protein
MKLRNKKTGEMGIINYFDNQSIVIYPIDENWNAKGDKKYVYHSLAELNEEWEDYEEPKEYWYIDYDGGILCGESDNSSAEKMMISMGNHFESLEEAEKAVERLRAWKRLKDKGFRFIDHIDRNTGQGMTRYEWDGYVNSEDLDLLFGGEE